MDNVTKELEELKNQYGVLGGKIKSLEEEMKKPKKKKCIERVKGQKYFCVLNICHILEYIDDFTLFEDDHYYSGNYFLTYSEALAFREILKTELDLFKLIHKLNQEESCPADFPNGEDKGQHKYYIYYSTYSEYLIIDYARYTKELPNKFYCYRDFLNDAIAEIGEERLIKYFKTI